MRARPVLIFAVLALVAPVSAVAASIHGTASNDRLKGTAKADLIDVVGGGRDTVSCGKGFDVVTADPADVVASDCELVSRRISSDPLTTPGAQHQTEVEPSALGVGSTVVAAFQVGRRKDGGAAGIGWATSRDAGRAWVSGILPGVTASASPPGAAPRASDPAVAYDAAHGQWLVSTLIIGDNFTALGISRSADGVTWSAPVLAANIPFASLGYDKEWIACDNSSTSRFYGSCYLVYTELSQLTPRLALQASRDGGATWTAPLGAATTFGADVVGALPLVQPDGTLTVVFDANGTGVYAVRSVDGGATFAAPIGISVVNEERRANLRVPSLPAAAVDAAGKLYVAWADCSLHPGCTSQDILFSTSMDGITWSPTARVGGGSADVFVPGIATDPSAPGHLAVMRYSLDAANTIGAEYTTSRDGGATWTKAQRLNTRATNPLWLAQAEGGRFLGDYLGATFADGRFVTVFVLAQPPATSFHQREFMMAASIP
jgi:hypothetical protein